MIVTIEPARPDHVAPVLANLRPWEKDRIAAVENAEQVIIDSIARSVFSFAALFDSEVACLCGIEAKTLLSDSVYVWLITSRAVDQHPILFLRHLRRIAGLVLAEYGVIEAHLFVDNPLPAKWLTWLGAELTPSPGNGGILDVRLRKDRWVSKPLC